MTKQRDLKRRIRQRMEKTGESYTTARLYLLQARTLATHPKPSEAPARRPLAPSSPSPVRVHRPPTLPPRVHLRRCRRRDVPPPRMAFTVPPSVMLLFIMVVALAGCGTAPAHDAVVTDSAGVTLVRNLGPDRPLDGSIVAVAELHVPDSALTAVPWGVAADPASGRIWVLDWSGDRVAAFDTDGTFAWWLGRDGSGPGEFENPVALAVDPQGALHVLDAGRRVVSRWSAGGDLLGEAPAPPS